MEISRNYMDSDVGKTIWSRGHEEKGIVTKESERYCALCGWHSCLIVKWEDGKRTKPCTAGIKHLENGDLEIKQEREKL